MKKLFFIFTLVFAFSISANAQTKKTATTTTTVGVKENPEVAAKKDADDLKALLSLNDTRTTDFYNLFKMKYETLAVPNISAERKAELSSIIEQKIRASVNADEMAKIEANATLFTRLTK